MRWKASRPSASGSRGEKRSALWCKRIPPNPATTPIQAPASEAMWGHSQALVVGNEHLLGCLAPAGRLVGLHAKCACLLGIKLHPLCRPAQVALSHEVGEDVVVSEGAVLVWPSDSVDAEFVGGGVEEPE